MKKIGVVGAGLVGSCFKGLDDFEVVHRRRFRPPLSTVALSIWRSGSGRMRRSTRTTATARARF